MKVSLAICALCATAVSAFAPQLNTARTQTELGAVNRRAAFAQIGAAAAAFALPTIANADGAVSQATIDRARGIYGSRIADLKSAVDKGDFGAVIAEKNAFVLFNSGAYPSAKAKALKKKAIDGTNKIFAAVKAKDPAALKSAYAAYVKEFDITGLPAVGPDGQGYCNDYDYRARTKAGSIYVR